jgi:uncharacterized protein
MTEAKKNRRIPRPPVGWPLLCVPENGSLHYPSLEGSIKAYIKILLLTRPREQLMRPWFGAGLSRFLHQSNTLETRQQIQDLVVETLARWEKRIVVDRVEVYEDKTPDDVRIEIAYRIKRSGAQAAVMLRMNLGS